MSLPDDIARCGAFTGFTQEEWRKLPACPHKCKYLRDCDIKWLCEHKNHPTNDGGKFKLSQRRKTLYLECPIKNTLLLKYAYILEWLFYKWLWKYWYKYEK